MASLLATEVGIPFLHEKILVLFNQFTNNRQLVTSKTSVGRQIDGIKPKLRVTAGMRNVNVRWFAVLETVEEESVTIDPEQYRHKVSLHPAWIKRPARTTMSG